jgi:acetyl esterase/lipase
MTDSESNTQAPQDAAPAAEDASPTSEKRVSTSVLVIPRETPPKWLRRRPPVGRWAARVALALLFLLGFFLSVVPAGRAVMRGALLLPSVLSATQTGALLAAGESFTHTTRTITSQTGPVFLDVYTPVGAPPPIPGSREALVMIPGVGDNRGDPQLINLSEALARIGVVIVNMTTPQLIGFKVEPAEADSVIQAFDVAARLPGVNPKGIGIVGFSGGSILACLAAADARIRDQVNFVATFGGIYNVTDVIRDFGLRYVVADGEKVPFNPYPDPIEVMANLVAGTLPPDEGQILIESLPPTSAPLLDPESVLTTPGAAAAYHLLAGDEATPTQVQQNLAALSPAVKQLLDALSPSRVLAQIHCPLYLLHDHNDRYVPFTESRDFDAALTRLGHPHEFAEFGIFHHTEISSGFGLGPLLGDGSKLYRILTGVLSASS